MVFFAQKVLRKLPGNFTFLIVTDRQELDEQIYKTFAGCGATTEVEGQAKSGENLRALLQGDHRYVFTLIQKFRTDRGEPFPKLSDRNDIIVITDEAHRSQYDIFAQNMRSALPNAAFLGFTGTPLMAGEEKTREVFGDYVSTYNFQESVEDGATVPLYYENRIPELQLTNDDLNEDMENLLEEAELNADQEAKLERDFAREYQLLTREERLNRIAKDIVEHFLGRGFAGKAMVISVDKITAARMYLKVTAHWEAHLAGLRQKLATASGADRDVLLDTITFMSETDMALIVSQSQNEVADMAAKGIDIKPLRKRMVTEDLATDFKSSSHPLRIVFVCAMWITGFDVPSCSTIYLDKPMKNHTLMQTIARANRVFTQKTNGLIVDYVGVFRNLQKALAIYAAPVVGGGDMPTKPPVAEKDELFTILAATVAAAETFVTNLGISRAALVAAEGFDRVKLLDDAVDILLASQETKLNFLSHASSVNSAFRAVLPEPRAGKFGPSRALFDTLAAKIKSVEEKADITTIMAEVDKLLDESVATEQYVIRERTGKNKLYDLSKIDFDKLREHFEQSQKNTEVQKLQAVLARELNKLVTLNKSRMDFLERFQEMIAEYNSGSSNVEQHYQNLLDFTDALGQEEKRSVSENLSEEELAVFDLLTRPRIELTQAEVSQIKRIAHDLLDTLKREKLVLDWRNRQQTRAGVRLAIEETLDELPTAFTPDIFNTKCQQVFEHVYESYFGEGRSVYTSAN